MLGYAAGVGRILGQIARLVGRAVDVDLVVGVGSDDIQRTISIEVARSQCPRLSFCGELSGGTLLEGAKGSIAEAEGDLYCVEVWSHAGDVKNPVAVEVSSHDGVRKIE